METTIQQDGVLLHLDAGERRAMNNALNWVISGVDALNPERWQAFGVTREWARALFLRQRSVEADADGAAVIPFDRPELEFVAEAVRSVLDDGRHRFPSGDIELLADVTEAEMQTVSDRLGAVVAQLRDA
jgi:hypothetical protein